MNRTFKTLLLWIIMIALPLQATAAVMKASCGSSHHAMQTHKAAPHGGMSAHMHDDSDNHSAHGSAQADHAHSGHASAPTDFADKAIEHDGHSTCSACASCNVGAVAPPSVHVKTPELATAIESAVASTSRFAGFIPAGLERPPRLFLA